MYRSEEDNDPLTDDGNSAVSVPIAITRHTNPNAPPPNRSSHPHSKQSPSTTRNVAKHHLAHYNPLSDSDGVDSPTYDGDVESSTTAGADTPAFHRIHHQASISSISTLNTPLTPAFPASSPPSTTTPSAEQSNPLSPSMRPTNSETNLPVFISSPTPAVNTNAAPLLVTEEPAVPAAIKEAFNPAALTPEDIHTFVAKAIEGEVGRKYKINPPPEGRPIRVYADGAPFFLVFLRHCILIKIT